MMRIRGRNHIKEIDVVYSNTGVLVVQLDGGKKRGGL